MSDDRTLKKILSAESQCFLAGAGVSHSCPSNLPLASDLFEIILSNLTLADDHRSEIERRWHDKSLRFEQFIEQVGKAYDDRDLHVLDPILLSRSPNGLHK